MAAEHVGGSLIGPSTLYPGASTPAKPGETVVIYANGFGTTSVPVISGSKTQSGTLATLPVIQIGGLRATVQFAGLVFPGEFQFNVVIPPTLGNGDHNPSPQHTVESLHRLGCCSPSTIEAHLAIIVDKSSLTPRVDLPALQALGPKMPELRPTLIRSVTRSLDLHATPAGRARSSPVQ